MHPFYMDSLQFNQVSSNIYGISSCRHEQNTTLIVVLEEIEQMSTTAAFAPATNPIFHLSHTFKCTTKGTRKTPTIQNHTNKKSMDNKKSVLAHEEHLLQSLTMHPSTFDSPPLHCKLFPPVHHSTAGDWSTTEWERPQVVRKCLNGTAANNVDFRITVKEGLCT